MAMPIRVMQDGTIVCDTADEAIAVRDRLLDRKVRETRREARRAGRQAPSLERSLTSNGTASLVAILRESPDGITSDDLARRLGMSSRSIPPLMLSLRRKFKDAGKDMDEMLVRERIMDSNNHAKSRYRLTEEGVKLLAG
jgi:hypothetical protein